MIARRIKEIFENGSSFEYLMSRFSTPDEIFGPIAISKLKDSDKYERITTGYLPYADVVFLDEIWKAGPSIQNALLTVVNEKIFRNGQEDIRIPLKVLISASNELPAKDEGLEALWDRFIVRYFVSNINEADNFLTFLREDCAATISIDDKIKFSKDEYEEIQELISMVELSEEAINTIMYIRNYISKYNNKKDIETKLYVSDRRWKKIVRILKTSAFLNDRNNVDLMDCFLIADMIWDEPEQIDLVKGFVQDAVKNHGYSSKYKVSMFNKEIQKLEKDIEKETHTTIQVEKEVLETIDINGTKYYELSIFYKDYYGNFNLISVKDFNALLKTRQDYVYLYNAQLKKREVYAMTTDGSIFIDRQDYPLKTKTEKETKIEYKEPHKAVIKEWQKQEKNIIEQIDKVLEEVKGYQTKELGGLRTNLFVDSHFADIAEINLLKTIDDFELAKANVLKLREQYVK